VFPVGRLSRWIGKIPFLPLAEGEGGQGALLKRTFRARPRCGEETTEERSRRLVMQGPQAEASLLDRLGKRGTMPATATPPYRKKCFTMSFGLVQHDKAFHCLNEGRATL